MLRKMDTITSILKEAGLAWDIELKPDQVLTHPSNRGGQMLGVEDVWSKGCRLMAVGLKKELLVGSVYFEISTVPDQKENQLKLNKALVKQSNGMLAPVQGKERYLSVGTSHSVAFFKALQAGCLPPNKPQVDLAIKAGEPLAEVLETGWV